MYEVPRLDDEAGRGCVGCLGVVSFMCLSLIFVGVFAGMLVTTSSSLAIQILAGVAGLVAAGILSYLIAQLEYVPQVVAFLTWADRFKVPAGIILFFLLTAACALL